MAFTPAKETYPGKVYPVTIGSGGSSATIGGENVLPFHSFEGATPNGPVIALEIQDVPPADWPENVKKPFEGVSDDPVKWAKFCQDELKAKAIALRLIGTHPDRENRSPEDAAKTVKDVLGCHQCARLLSSEATILRRIRQCSWLLPRRQRTRNCIIGKAQEANYKTIAAAAMANNHKLIAMSELDINLSKQLNILIARWVLTRKN